MKTKKMSIRELMNEVLRLHDIHLLINNGPTFSEQDEFLSFEEIAYRANGISYEKNENRKKPITTEEIIRNVSSASKLALEMSPPNIIIAYRKKHKCRRSKSNKRLGLKYANKNGDDNIYIRDNKQIRKDLANGNMKNRQEIIEATVQLGICARRRTTKALSQYK